MKKTYELDDFKQGLKDRKRALRRRASGQKLAKYGKRAGAMPQPKRALLRDEARAEDAMEELDDNV